MQGRAPQQLKEAAGWFPVLLPCRDFRVSLVSDYLNMAFRSGEWQRNVHALRHYATFARVSFADGTAGIAGGPQ